MSTYSYIAKNKDGQEVRSSIDTDTRLDALESLRKKGLTVVDLFTTDDSVPREIVSLQKESSPTNEFLKTFWRSDRVKMTDLALFCRQLSISVNAGIPLRDAVESVGLESEQPALRKVSKDIVEQLHEGRTFSQAVARHPKVFNQMFQGLIKVAEETGKLPSTLNQLSSYLERADRLQRRVRAMAAYPLFIGVFFVVICLIMTLFILPRFVDIFVGFGSELPVFTRVVFGINSFFFDNFAVVLAGGGGIVCSYLFLWSNVGGRLSDRPDQVGPSLCGVVLEKIYLSTFLPQYGDHGS